jgi:hypothetical protein
MAAQLNAVDSAQKNKPMPMNFTRYGSIGAGQPNPAIRNITMAMTNSVKPIGASRLGIVFSYLI